MTLIIRPLTPELLKDYLHFFDDVAFTDHSEWAWCYCTFYHLGRADEERIEAEHKGNFSRDVLRNVAIELIRTGTLNGYLAYRNGSVVGWLNAADKRNYKKIVESAELWEEGDETPTKAITCFIVAPDARRQGVATALLDRAVSDAKAEGFARIEAYPGKGELDCFRHYHGHPEMYEKCGFERYKEFEHYTIHRRAIP